MLRRAGRASQSRGPHNVIFDPEHLMPVNLSFNDHVSVVGAPGSSGALLRSFL